jgi:hypothetical protein
VCADRNDNRQFQPLRTASTKWRRSLARNISSPTKKAGAPNTPRSMALAVALFRASLALPENAFSSNPCESLPILRHLPQGPILVYLVEAPWRVSFSPVEAQSLTGERFEIPSPSSATAARVVFSV